VGIDLENDVVAVAVAPMAQEIVRDVVPGPFGYALAVVIEQPILPGVADLVVDVRSHAGRPVHHQAIFQTDHRAPEVAAAEWDKVSGYVFLSVDLGAFPIAHFGAHFDVGCLNVRHGRLPYGCAVKGI